MRSRVIGLVLGAILTIGILAAVRQQVIQGLENDLSFDFNRYVFSESAFPTGDFREGRLVHRLLFPTRFSITYYDAQYHEVKQAGTPGRYGAVVRINISGSIAYRFVTLYRTASKMYWADTPWSLTMQLPPELGFDPTISRQQQLQISEILRDGFVEQGEAASHLAVLLAGLSETSPNDPTAVERNNAVARDEAWWYGLRKQLGLQTEYPYLTNLPTGYEADTNKRWPLILYLHSGAECGNDLSVVRRTALPRVLEAGKQIPAIVISPQCPAHEWWSPEALADLLDKLSAKYRIDPDHIYLTGGTEVWTLALAYPQKFAAILPLDGDTDPADAARLKDLPTWAFHVEGDAPTRLSITTDMLDAIRKAGGHPHLAVSTRHGDVWDQVYPEDAVYTWLFAQKREQPDTTAPVSLNASNWLVTW